MPDIIFVLNIALCMREQGITAKTTKQVREYNNAFLSLCYALVISGHEPSVIRLCSIKTNCLKSDNVSWGD